MRLVWRITIFRLVNLLLTLKHHALGEESSHNEEEGTFAEQNRPYRVVSSAHGGWPSSFVSGSFDIGEEVYCHADASSCDSGEGVDYLFRERSLWCDVLEDTAGNDESTADHVRLTCEETEEEITMPSECCERFRSGDTTVYATPQGLVHYATFGDGPRTVAIGMQTMEQTYETVLRERQATEQPMLLYYRNDDDPYSENSNIPLRVKQSSRNLASIHRTLLKSQTDIVEGKFDAAVLAQEVGLNVQGGPFPVTYFSYEEALKSTDDASAQFFVKPAWASWGRGIEVKTRAELMEMWENDAEENATTGELIIQEAITDLKLIGGCRFDIRFYILVHGGRVYLHDTGIATWPPGVPFDASSPQQATDFAHKYLTEYDEEDDLLNTFLSSETTGEGKRWLDAIYHQIVASLPFLEPLIHATKESDTLYQIFGGDAMIRENGGAVITEFNDYPWVDWSHGQVISLDDYGNETGERSFSKGRALYEDAVSTMFADFFSIVLGLADTVPESADTESCPSSSYILDGRVREAVPLKNAQIT